MRIQSDEAEQEVPYRSVPEIEPVNCVALKEVPVRLEVDEVFDECQNTAEEK